MKLPQLDPLLRPGGEEASRSEAMKVAVDFSPPREETTLSRVAERRLNASVPVDSSAVATRRRLVCLDSVRGLKPTATIVVSLRETEMLKLQSPPLWRSICLAECARPRAQQRVRGLALRHFPTLGSALTLLRPGRPHSARLRGPVKCQSAPLLGAALCTNCFVQ
jgi:hypothetical protein